MLASLTLTGPLAWLDSAASLPVVVIITIAALVAGLIAVILGVLASLAPALMIQRLPLAQILAQE
ncbi:hypothetical protein [Acrocarpospora pleiomorpha]|uniref:hypothetical protein n=1 Tax=Acrocarpospora pleiomorpha TaxID=90975 RepID=UPI0012D33401